MTGRRPCLEAFTCCAIPTCDPYFCRRTDGEGGSNQQGEMTMPSVRCSLPPRLFSPSAPSPPPLRLAFRVRAQTPARARARARARPTRARVRMPARARASSRPAARSNAPSSSRSSYQLVLRWKASGRPEKSRTPVLLRSKIAGMSVPVDFGLGLRPEHYEEIAASPGRVSWFEALSENYMVPGGTPAPLARPLPSRLSDGAARRVVVDRLDRSARPALSRRARRR